MPQQITEYNVFIASPGDVAAERDAVESAIAEWNRRNSEDKRVQFKALRWEGRTLPNIEDRAQESINKNLLSKADLLVAVFWTRIGTPTGGYPGGTIEELKKFGKDKLVYWCKRAFPYNWDLSQLDQVKKLMADWQLKGASPEEFQAPEDLVKTLVDRHLTEWLKQQPQAPAPSVVHPFEESATAFRDAAELRSELHRVAQADAPGILLLFNIELETFRDQRTFHKVWQPLGASANILRIVMVLPPHKWRRLFRYVSSYAAAFRKMPGMQKFEVAEFTDGEIPATAFAAFRLGDDLHNGSLHSRSLHLVLSEPFAEREKAPDPNGPVWSYRILLVSSDSNDPISSAIEGLLSRYLPGQGSPDTERLDHLLKRIQNQQTQDGNDDGGIPSPQNAPVALDRRMAIREDLFASNVPTYVLDDKYNLLDWNVAFDLIFGHCGFHRGDFVLEFLKCLVNAEAAKKRGEKFVGEPPLFDDEPFIFESPAFGRMHFRKITAQAVDHSKGLHQGWNVALSVTSVERDEVFFERLRSIVKYETLMSTYAPAYNRIMSKFPPYTRLVELMADAITEAHPGRELTVLDLGAGPGLCARALAGKNMRVVAIESNEAMLACAQENCSYQVNTNRILIHKANLESIHARELLALREEEFRPPYDAAVLLNVFYAINDKARLLRLVKEVLKPGGTVVLSGPHDGLDKFDLDRLYGMVEKQARGGLAEDDLRLFKKVNDRMFVESLLTQTVQATTDQLRQAGFEVLRTATSVFAGQGMLIEARLS